MKRSSSRIREEIERLQEQLKQAEHKEAERIGRLALKAGLGDLVIQENELSAAFQDLASQFRGETKDATGQPAARPQPDNPDA
ncbi:MAG: TraC family protein [Pseudorhizobium sp.]